MVRCVSGKACGAGAWVDADGAGACMAFSFGAWFGADGAGACMAFSIGAWFGVYV